MQIRQNMNDKRCIREKIISLIRDYFHKQDFIETDTPTFVFCPGMEPHIRSISFFTSDGLKIFLPTSPEFAMKRLLASGYEKIFQICKAYRAESKSATHNPEFTILEWYRSQATYEKLMDDVEKLFQVLCTELYGSLVFETKTYGKQDLTGPWSRITVEECFKTFCNLNLRELRETKHIAQACIEKGFAAKKDFLNPNLPGLWDDFFFRIWMNEIEPKLKTLGKPVIVYLYPESQSALSNLIKDKQGFVWAKRFEVYAGGLELGNAFDELTDPVEQRNRFKKDMVLRERLYGKEFPINPMDEEFLEALKSMPQASGIAMGVDRIAMYFTGADHIEEVLWLPSYWR